MKRIVQVYKLAILGISLSSVNGCQQKETQSPSPSKNVNVSSSVFSASTWSFATPSHYVNINVPTLTSANLDSSAVMVYCSTGGDWQALPFTHYDSPYNYYMNFSTGVGNVQVTWTYDTSFGQGKNPNTYFGATVKFKIVVIPPSARIGIDLRDYEAVEREFGLKD